MTNSNKEQTDYLRFSAYSIKDLITRKLSQDTRFTDQIYEGSNLAILIDIFSYMAQNMMYALNNAAAESMFADTQLYENMNRLIKFIDYHPHGCGAKTMSFVIDNADQKYFNQHIFNYSYIDTNLTDKYGKKVYYSAVQDITNDNSIDVTTDSTYEILLYNGKWHKYNTVFTSSGEANQHFILEGLGSNTEDDEESGNINQTLVPHGMINVYVDESGKLDDNSLKRYEMVEHGIFSSYDIIHDGSTIYNENDTIFDLRLNENKTYEISFGNGTTGHIPKKNAKIYVFYLDTNNGDIDIGLGDIVNKKLNFGPDKLGIDETLLKQMFPTYVSSFEQEIYKSGLWKNNSINSQFVSEETVDDIRNNAPQWFKTGNRLITNNDYEYFFKYKNKTTIIDVKCQNNWEYITTFYRWLYNLGLNGALAITNNRTATLDSKNYYINQNRMRKYDYKWSDAADSNNVYLWIKMYNDSDILKSSYSQQIKKIKTITQEVVYLKPLDLFFSPCAENIETAVNYFIGDSKLFDPNCYNYIEITLDDNCLYTNLDIRSKVASVIQNFFEEKNLKLGMLIDYNKLTNQIYNIGNISNIRTVYKKNSDCTIRPGVSFATWSNEFIDIGDDLDVSTTSKQLEPFQFPKLYNSNTVENRIKIIRKTLSNINTIQY